MIFARLFAWAALGLCFSLNAHALDTDRKDVRAFIEQMAKEHDYDRAQLSAALASADIKQPILEAISKPAERRLSWAEYRKIFITPERIRAGARFWREHEATLQRISEQTGVSCEMLVGIIGVETYFGRITGKHRVIDALATLAFDYPPRSNFFRRELQEYLLLVREEGMPATQATGSYAGAMGRPQFMPSSFRAYAVDSSGDGKRDIWNNWADAIGSVANYFVRHGWKPGQAVTARSSLGKRWTGTPPENTLKATTTVEALSRQGALFATELDKKSPAQLLTLEGAGGTEHWVGFHNFFVITRYNRSVMYALAVHQLGNEIAREVAKRD